MWRLDVYELDNHVNVLSKNFETREDALSYYHVFYILAEEMFSDQSHFSFTINEIDTKTTTNVIDEMKLAFTKTFNRKYMQDELGKWFDHDYIPKEMLDKVKHIDFDDGLEDIMRKVIEEIPTLQYKLDEYTYLTEIPKCVKENL